MKTPRDRVLFAFAGTTGVLASGITLLVFVFLASEALPLLQDVPVSAFLTDASWSPRDSRYGLLAMIAGSAWVVAGAVALSTPLGILLALFFALYAPRWIAGPMRAWLAIMAGVPSVVYGLWGLTVLVPVVRTWQQPGVSVLAGIIVLALMILPTMALLADGAIRAVPQQTLRAAAAMGLGPWGIARSAVLPAARRGLVAASILQVARAAGETMAVLMVMGNTIQFPTSLFDPARALTGHIALEMGYAIGDHRRALFAAALFLLMLVGGLVGAAHLASRGERAMP